MPRPTLSVFVRDFSAAAEQLGVFHNVNQADRGRGTSRCRQIPGDTDMVSVPSTGCFIWIAPMPIPLLRLHLALFCIVFPLEYARHH